MSNEPIRPTGRRLPPELGIEHNWEAAYQLQANDVFVEVGGYDGKYARYASPRCRHIYLIEPNPDRSSELMHLASELGNVTIIPYAVGEKNCERRFVVNRDGASASRVLGDEEDAEEKTNMIPKKAIVNVQVRTLETILDQQIIRRVNLLGADCENCEVSLVESAGRWLSKDRVKHWAVGVYHHPDNPGKVRAILESAGYNCLIPDGIVYAC